MSITREQDEPIKSIYANLLNALSDMQQSPVYAVRKSVLWEAECIIVKLDLENAALREELAVVVEDDVTKLRQRVAELEALVGTIRGCLDIQPVRNVRDIGVEQHAQEIVSQVEQQLTTVTEKRDELQRRVAELEQDKLAYKNLFDENPSALYSQLATVTREREFYIKQNLALLERWNHGYTVTVEQARDALKAQLAAVTRERDAVREKSTEFWQRIVAAFAPAEVENIEVAVLLITTQKARLREVEGALRAYGRHSTTDRVCALSQHSDWACDCGLDAALHGPSEKEGL